MFPAFLNKLFDLRIWLIFLTLEIHIPFHMTPWDTQFEEYYFTNSTTLSNHYNKFRFSFC